MQQTVKPVSQFKRLLLWCILIGNIFFWIGLIAWLHRNDPTPAPDESLGSTMLSNIVMFILGCFFIAGGIGGYFLVIGTNCFTFNFAVPFFTAYKGKLYLAKIFIPVLLSVGLGLWLGIILTPVLCGFGVHGQLGFLLPLLLVIVPLQILQMWVNVWTPMVRKLITKRLAARNISQAQVQAGILTGISDPTKNSFKKLTLIEDDIGALWLGADQLIYWGDVDGFAFRREEIIELERRADAGSTSMLAGTRHVILHIRQPDGTVRQIRLHAEGHWTLSLNRQAMDALATAITQWHSAAQSPVAPTA